MANIGKHNSPAKLASNHLLKTPWQRGRPRTDPKVPSSVQSAFEKVPPTTLLRNFVTLKEVMNLIMKEEGSNQFKIPHVKKSKRLRAGEDIETVHCNVDTVQSTRQFLDNPGCKE